MIHDLSEFHAWFAERSRRNAYQVTRAPLDGLDGWQTDPATGNIAHRSGKFFSVQGLAVTTDHRETSSWSQPIILQPEIGILGLLVRLVGDTVYCLMQAKMEPGNINLVQLSPTIQATRSNYTRVHRGDSVPYLEYFVAPRPGRAVFDALQSEQGTWFLDKRNRNMIVEVDGPVPAREDFCWLSLEQIAELLKAPNLINMDARTVLSGAPFLFHEEGARPDSTVRPLHSHEHLLSWFTEARARYHLGRNLLPLSRVARWRRVDGRVVHEEGRHFSVMGVDVQASNREVSRWSQPMIEPCGRGVVGFLGRHVGETFHVLVHARTEAGTHDVIEMAPTVSCIPANYAGLPAERWPRYLTEILDAPPSRRLVDVVHSEEGGRFFHAESRYIVVDLGEDFDLDVPDDFCWMTVDQLVGFVRYGNYVNVAARCLLTCLATGSEPLGRRVLAQPVVARR
ncbi:NDP-hexose 2,3-dehydratase family protein [Plantactinospora sp. B6F1]|uniref:NDP-hexose 2,3-dehydratase family protein n=1 Tax=Plantactinospora sp. B6F1 TaxID=3158971 RepID=UPI00102BEBDA